MESVRYYWHEGEWNVPKIFRTVPTHIAQVICQIPIAAGQDDKIVWTRSMWGVLDESNLGDYPVGFPPAATSGRSLALFLAANNVSFFVAAVSESYFGGCTEEAEGI
ncbi:UNVERIFIED_CONTAM: hypothetical protein Slati_0490800 [Sesamum latifolium]|uniref:Uncharacterized protein n=1 Tax=Sesamum latifolium TaxID=2727402 RepID=A0AAW2Y0J8_9LAMI